MSRRNKRKHRADPLKAVAAAKRIGDLLEGVKPEVIDAGPCKHPIWVYMDKKWVVVEGNENQFPFPVLQQVTPEWALEVIAERNINNRKADPRRVRKYASDIINKRWHVINNGVGFFEDGTLADGQHRLLAVIETEKIVPMIVVYGVHPSATVAIDEGRPRSNADVGKILGMNVSNTALSASNYILEYSGVKANMSRADLLEFYDRHSDAIQGVMDMFSGTRQKGIFISPVISALARAWYTQDRARLAVFVDILSTGICSDPNDNAPAVLRSFLIRQMHTNTGTAREDKYRKVESAIVNFMNRKPIRHLNGMSDEQFPVPETICNIN